MDNFKIINQVKVKSCRCDQIPTLAHEINQSLLVIDAYVIGCTEQLKVNRLDNKQLTEVLKKISQHTELISNKINCMLSRT